MENNIRKVFVKNNFGSQGAEKYSSIFKQDEEKQVRKIAKLCMTYQGNLNNTNSNQSKIGIIVEWNLNIICQTNFASVKMPENDYSGHRGSGIAWSKLQ